MNKYVVLYYHSGELTTKGFKEFNEAYTFSMNNRGYLLKTVDVAVIEIEDEVSTTKHNKEQ